MHTHTDITLTICCKVDQGLVVILGILSPLGVQLICPHSYHQQDPSGSPRLPMTWVPLGDLSPWPWEQRNSCAHKRHSPGSLLEGQVVGRVLLNPLGVPPPTPRTAYPCPQSCQSSPHRPSSLPCTLPQLPKAPSPLISVPPERPSRLLNKGPPIPVQLCTHTAVLLAPSSACKDLVVPLP